MFFRTSDGRLHVGRLGGVLYTIGVAPGCIEFHDLYCFAAVTFIAGWCLCFGAKQRRTFREMLDPVGIFGTILMVLGIAGQFYFVRRR
jgi:hypothetical protein